MSTKAVIRLIDLGQTSRTVEISADLYDEAGQVSDGVIYDETVRQLRVLVDAVVSASYGYHRKVAK